jgi:hypothetical protein
MCSVRRSDLYTRSQSASPTPSEPDPELEAQFRARLASIYGPPSNRAPVFIPAAHDEPTDINGGCAASEEQVEQEFEFRLFATTRDGKPGDEEGGTTQKIILVDGDVDVGDGGFVVRERNRRHYFAEHADGDRRRGFETMALSGEEVLSRARRRAWGLEVPWRVRTVKVAGKKRGGEAGDTVIGVQGIERDPTKRRPGKKRRIILRERKKSREKLQEQKKAEKEKKEEAEREKRTRRNREKKVKRKMKEKAKKAGGPVEDPGNGTMRSGEQFAGTTHDQISDQ